MKPLYFNGLSPFKNKVILFFLLLPITFCAQEQWFPIGPAAIKNGPTYGTGRIEVSGRATVIATNPQNPQDVWLGTSNGGVWYSKNAGLPGMNWKPMTDDLPSMAIGAIALKDCGTTRCNTIYIGTGENNIRRHTYYGRGIYKLQWVGGEFPIYTSSLIGTTDQFFKYGAINDIIFDGSTMYVSVSEGRASSGAQVTVIAPQPVSGYGVFKSTDDGVTWDKIGGTGNDLPSDMELINGELFAGFIGKGIFKLNAAGTDWCPLNPGNISPSGCSLVTSTLPNISEVFDHIELAASPSNPLVVYAIFGKCPSVTLTSCLPELYKSIDGGATWNKINYTIPSSEGIVMLTYSRYTHALAVHPTNPNTVLYGGLVINKSNDGGASFDELGTDSTHPDHQDLNYPDPSNPDLLYGVNDGGFYFSLDGGICWNSGNYDLQITSFYSIASNSEPIPGTTTVPPLVIGGAQDNGTSVFNGSRVWQHILGGDGGDSAIENPSIMFASSQLFGARRSISGANSGSFFPYSSGIDTSEDVAFYPPYLQHSSTKDLYFGAEKLYKTSSVGIANWQAISPDFDNSSTQYPAIETGNVISAVAVAPSDPNRIYVGLYNGDIWRTKNSGGPCATMGCWKRVGGPGDPDSGLPNEVVSSLAVHPTNPDKVYVTYSGFNLPGGDHVYTSNTGGDNVWTQVSNSLPDIPSHVLKINPDNPDILWLGTDQGVFKSPGAGSTWESFGPLKGMPNVPVYDFAIDNFAGRVYAATHGRGAFMLTSNPVLYTFEGWMDSEIWDILVYGEGFTPSSSISSCTVEIILENGDVCASGTVDSYGDTNIEIGVDGSLVTDRQFVWEGRPVIAACLNGDCVGGVDISNCLDPSNRISSIRVTCGGQVAFARISEDCPQQANPPSSVLDVDSPTSPMGPTCASTMSLSLEEMVLNNDEGELDVIITLASTSPANGGDRILCGTRVKYNSVDTPREIAVKIKDAINKSASCSGENIEATVPIAPPRESMGEDFIMDSPSISVSAPNLTAGQLIVSIRDLPEGPTSSCFSQRGLGQFALNQLAIMRTTVVTENGGAKGGEIFFTETSHLGSCTISIATSPGQSAEEIASSIHSKMMNMTEPGTLLCEARQNPYDIKLEGASLVTVMADGLTFCSTDPGVGFASGPDGLNLIDYVVDGQDDFSPSWAVSLHTGITSPLGSFNSFINSGYSLEFDIEYQFAPHFSLEALGGHYGFSSSYDINGGALFLKGYLTKQALRPFLSAGVGLYKPDFEDLSVGLGAGIGINFQLFANVEGEIGTNYHYIFKDNPPASFLNNKLGLKFRF